MKNFKFLKSLLVLIGVLITSLTTNVWAGWNISNAHIYFDNTNSGWSDEGDCKPRLVTRKEGGSGSGIFAMAHLSHTQLYYANNSFGAVSDILFAATVSTYDWYGYGEYARDWSGLYTLAGGCHYTGNYGLSIENASKLFYAASSSDNAGLTKVDLSSYSSLNNSQTVKKYTWNGSSYSAASVNSGTVTISAYQMTGDGIASNTDNSATLDEASETSTSVNAARTGEVTLTATANAGYVFMGWYSSENGGSSDLLSSDAEYTYNAPNSTKTVYARFAETISCETLYLSTTSTWRNDGAKFEAVFCDAKQQKWAELSAVGGTDNMYSVSVPSGDWGYVILCRMNPSGTAHSFDGKWNQTGDMYRSGTCNCVNITGDNSGSWCRYSKNPVIIRSHNDWDPENADVMTYSDSKWNKSLNFNEHSTYQVRILDGITEYGLNDLVVTSSIANYNLYSGQYQLRIATAGDGDYAFAYDQSAHQLSISYPTVTHPTVDYCYLIDYSGASGSSGSDWSAGTYGHWWNSVSGVAETTSPGTQIQNKITINEVQYFYFAPGDYASVLLSANGHSTHRYQENTISSGYGKNAAYNTCATSVWSWCPFSFTVTLTEQVTTSTAPSDPSVEFNGTAPSSVTAPTCAYYDFCGYYSAAGGGGLEIINKNGAWQSSKTGYTSSTAKWIHEGGTAELFGKWTQTITLNQNDATKNGATEIEDVVYNATFTPGELAQPKKIGYAFAGWTATKDGDDVVIAADGTVNTVSGWTDGDKKWIHNASSTLFAKWTADVNNFKADAATTAWGTADNWSKGKVPTNDYSTINILGNVVMSSGTSVFVGEVNIDGGSLTINAGAVLEVAGTVTNSDASKLVIESNASNQGALILNNSSATTKATVNIYTKLNTYDSYQVIALPVTYAGVSESFAGSGVYTYVWNEGDGWERRGYYDDLSAFEAIGLMQTASHTYTISGTLASTEDFSETLAYTTGTYQGTNVYGNSWTAPIKIKKISIPAEKAEQTVNILENGNWVAYTLGSVTNQVVPAMQAFAIKATASGGNVTIDYDDAVRGNTDYRTEALRAPQHTTSEGLEEMVLAISGDEKQTRLRLREDARFTEEFDNGWEATYLEGDGLSGQLFVQKDDKMVVLAEPDLEGTVVGLIPGVATDYTISFEGNGDGYYLNDMVTEQSTLIAEGNTYMFTADANTNATRFVISCTPIRNMPTGVDVINDGTKARKQLINGVLYIIRDGRLYNATGAKVK